MRTSAADRLASYDKVRVDGDEHKEVEDAYISWPVLAAIKDGQPLTMGLRHSSVARKAIDSKRTLQS